MTALDPTNVQVDSFAVETALPLPGDGNTLPTQRTHERDCTMPGICPETW